MKNRTLRGCGIVNGKSNELEIAKNLKMLDWLKAELAESVAALFKALLEKGNEAVLDALAAIIIICYLIGQRAGFSFLLVDNRIKEKLRISINNAIEEDSWKKELSNLAIYLQKSKR